METRSKYIFLALVLTQIAHSLEEFYFRLYDVFAPARFVSSLASNDLATGFAIVNIVFICFGLWCYVVPVHHGHTSARSLAWLWVIVEFANGVGHILVAMVLGGYFPGVITAIPLVVLSIALGRKLIQTQHKVGNAA